MNLPQLNSEAPLFYDANERMKARYQAMKDQGLCTSCGDEVVQGKTMCQPCLSEHNEYSKEYAKKKKPSDSTHGEPFAITTTGQHYRVNETSEIGVIVPCPCDNPIILEFKDGQRDAFFLRELEATTHPITNSIPTRGNKNGGTGRPHGASRKTIKRMLQIHQFLMKQTEPVLRSEIEKHIGFACVRTLMIQASQKSQISLEHLGIVKRIQARRTWLVWELTQLGRERGEDLINSLK